MAKPFTFLVLTIALPYVIYFFGAINYYSDYVKHMFQTEASSQTYDFIIVGGGSSGAVVALRLSQYYKVLLLEAGGEPIFLNQIPALAVELLGYPEYDWQYKTVPQIFSGFGTENNQITSNRGKVLGGTSMLNYMLYLRGNPLDYDNWANITGDDDWKYENILPYFKKSIKDYRGNFKQNKKHYESSPYGFLTVESMNWDEKLLPTLNRAAGELGYANGIDVNGPQTPGFGNIELTQNYGERMSTHAAILEQLDQTQNIRILKYAQVTKIKFDKPGNAIGVWYSHFGTRKLALASKEIVLSAGAYDSPKLLMLSGIGPKDELEPLGIKVRVDLPVGKNLQDHINNYIIPVTINTSASVVLERDIGLGALYDYVTKGKGVLTAPSGVSGQGFWSSSQAQKEAGGNWPNIQYLFFPVGPSSVLKDAFARALGMKPQILSQIFDKFDGEDGFLLCPLLVRPKSRGQVTLKDKNPFSDPVIDPNFLSAPEDMEAMVEAFRFGLQLIEETDAFQDIGAKLGYAPIAECGSYKYRSDLYWKCHIRYLLSTVWHPVGTCAMGKPSEKSTVVDSKLRVLGVRGLRVVDSSIMPVIVNANTNGPAIMIGEKGADMILEHWTAQKLVSQKLDIFVGSKLHQCRYA